MAARFLILFCFIASHALGQSYNPTYSQDYQIRQISDLTKYAGYFSIGESVFVSGTGQTYTIQEDSVKYYATDDSLVVDLMGKYAVIDYSKKRVFKSKEELKAIAHFCRFQDDETITVGSATYRIRYAPQIYFRTLPLAITNDTIVDGFFIDTIQTEIKNRNLVLFPETVHNVTYNMPNGNYNPYTWLTANPIYIPQNVEQAPDGTMTAELLYGFNSTSFNSFSCAINNAGISSGDTLTFSFYYKGVKTTGTNERFESVTINGGSTSSHNIPLTLDGEWHRGSIVHVAGTDGTPGYYVSGQFNGFANADTLAITWLSLVKGSVLTDYERSFFSTKAIDDKLYLYRDDLIKGETLDLTSIKKKEITPINNNNRDAQFIQSAIDYCADGERCNTVLLPKDNFWVKTPLVMKRGVVLSGTTPSFRTQSANNPVINTGTVIYAALTDKTKYLFNLDTYGTYSIIDNSGISNLFVYAVDTLAGFVQTKGIQACKFSYLTMQELTSGGYTGAVDSVCFDFQGEADNHYNLFDHVTAGGNTNTPVGLRYGSGVGNLFTQCNFLAKVGVEVQGGVLQANNMSVEGSKTGILMTSGEGRIDRFYTEATASGSGATIKMIGGSLNISNSTLQTNGGSDTLLHIISGKNLEIENSIIRLSGKAVILDSLKSIVLRNIGSDREIKSWLSLSDYLKTITEISGNYPWFTDSDYYKNSYPAMAAENTYFRYGVSESQAFTDTMFLSDITLLGKKENLISQSDSVGPNQTTAFFNTYNNVEVAPDGTMTADVIAITAPATSAFISNKTALSSYELGRPYTVSMYLKNLGATNPSTSVVIRAGGSPVGPEIKLRAVTNDWQRYYGTFYATSADVTTPFRINSLIAGDSIAVWGVQVNKGYSPLTKVTTTSTGINENRIVFKANNPVIFQSGLEVETTTSAFMPPKMTTAQRDVLTPVEGWMIYNTTTNKAQVYNGSTWNNLY